MDSIFYIKFSYYAKTSMLISNRPDGLDSIWMVWTLFQAPKSNKLYPHFVREKQRRINKGCGTKDFVAVWYIFRENKWNPWSKPLTGITVITKNEYYKSDELQCNRGNIHSFSRNTPGSQCCGS
jgi:hypothetical protein